MREHVSPPSSGRNQEGAQARGFFGPAGLFAYPGKAFAESGHHEVSRDEFTLPDGQGAPGAPFSLYDVSFLVMQERLIAECLPEARVFGSQRSPRDTLGVGKHLPGFVKAPGLYQH